jgi:hypothetical protein
MPGKPDQKQTPAAPEDAAPKAQCKVEPKKK